MGTPEFGVPVLRRVVAAGHEVAAVVTQPDRPVGRSGRPVPPPVKQAAQELGIPVLQPARLREAGVIDALRHQAPEVIVVAAFGQLLPAAVLEIPKHKSLNVHASLLPKYRGAAPIPAAILAGEKKTGITIMIMAPELDAGPVLSQRAEPIDPRDTAESLTRRLAGIGGDLLVETLPRWVAGQIAPRAQDEREATYAPALQKGMGEIDWRQSAEQIDRKCRAYAPWPGCHSHWQGRLLKLLEVQPITGELSGAAPGTVLEGRDKQELLVVTGAGMVSVRQLQVEGKRPMSGADFLRGQRGIVGGVLG